MGKPQNIYWVTETEDNRNYISMQAPGRCFNPKRKKCHFPKPSGRSIVIDNSNNITIKQENKQIIKDNKIDGNNNNAGGDQSNTATVDATQVSVFVVVPIIDSFNEEDDDYPYGPLGNYRVAAGGQNLDIQVNGNGTYVNGQKVEESQLEDGTRVYVYRNDTVGTQQK